MVNKTAIWRFFLPKKPAQCRNVGNDDEPLHRISRCGHIAEVRSNLQILLKPEAMAIEFQRDFFSLNWVFLNSSA